VVKVSGIGFGAGERVSMSFDSKLLTARSANASGQFGPVAVTVPASALPGVHHISARGQQTGRVARAAFHVRTDWTQFRFNAAHTGVNPFENVLTPQNVHLLAKKWFFSTGNVVVSGPAVAAGVVYIGSVDNSLYAIKAATGTEAWSFPTVAAV